jgi:hypothetical protein
MLRPIDPDRLLIGDGGVVILDCHLDHWSDSVCGDKNALSRPPSGVVEQTRNIGDIGSSSKALRLAPKCFLSCSRSSLSTEVV